MYVVKENNILSCTINDLESQLKSKDALIESLMIDNDNKDKENLDLNDKVMSLEGMYVCVCITCVYYIYVCMYSCMYL